MNQDLTIEITLNPRAWSANSKARSGINVRIWSSRAGQVGLSCTPGLKLASHYANWKGATVTLVTLLGWNLTAWALANYEGHPNKTGYSDVSVMELGCSVSTWNIRTQPRDGTQEDCLESWDISNSKVLWDTANPCKRN